MNYYIKINSAALRNDSKKVAELVGNAEKELKEAYTAMKELDAMWEGPANEAFVHQFVADYENFKSVCEYVKSFSSQLELAAKEYERCEENVNSAIKAIRV